MAFRPEFSEAIGLLAQAAAVAAEKGASAPVLVGGGAVELYTSSAVTSGDFDLVTPDHEILAAALEDVGFERRAKTGLQLSHPKLHIAQAFSVNPPRKDMLDQAVKLLQVAPEVDRAYLDKRVLQETSGEANLAFLEKLANADRST